MKKYKAYKWEVRKQEYQFHLTIGKIPMSILSGYINNTEDETLLNIFIHFHANDFRGKTHKQAVEINKRRPGWYLEKEVMCLLYSLTNTSLRDLVVRTGISYDLTSDWIRHDEFRDRAEQWRMVFVNFVIEYQDEICQCRELIKDIDLWSEGVKTRLLNALLVSSPYYVIDGKNFRPVDGKTVPAQA